MITEQKNTITLERFGLYIPSWFGIGFILNNLKRKSDYFGRDKAMDKWFTINEIDSDTFSISEHEHWEEINCFLLCGTKRCALIDTGLGVINISDVVRTLTALPIMILTTHVHWDHIGSHRYFDNISVHEAEKDWLSTKFPIPLQVVINNLMLKPCIFPESFSIDNYRIFQGEPNRVLHDNDIIDLGNRQIAVIHTPGHSPGHCCFYEPDRKYLYSGDLIYKGCLDAFYPTTDPMLFYHSVKKVRQLNVDKILPAHHELNIPVELIKRIENAFAQLEDKGILGRGNGIFDFGEFQIHI